MDFTNVAGFLAGLAPEPLTTVSDWADTHRRLSPKAAAEPGPWRTDRAPYLRAIMDALSTNNSIEDVVVMKGAQLGLTEAGNNWVGYIIHNAPAPTLMVMPTESTMKRNSQLRIDPMIEATPVLQEKVKPARSRDSGNTQLQKDFPGGVLMMAGANSASGLRSMPVRNLFLDEIDAYPADLEGEGSPIDLAKARTRTFRRRKIYLISTPTVQGSSAIEKEFSETEQQFYFVPCPTCGAEQILSWANMRWDKTAPPKKQAESARYECIHCGDLIAERFKSRMLAGGTWRVTKPENLTLTRVGFHISSLYSPWYTWAEIVQDWLDAQGKTEKLKTFINTVLGEVWVSEGEAPAWQQLYERRESFDGETVVPNAVGVVTAGADIQKDRIEVEVVGWAENNESYSLAYYILTGDTGRAEVWEKLGVLLDTKYLREDGVELKIRSTAVDTGYQTQAVYTFAKGYPADTVIPIKGQESQRTAIAAPQAVQRKLNGKRSGSTRLINVGVSLLKSELYGWLNRRRNEDGTLPPGFCHFPTKYDEHYFKMLTAEKLVYKANARGFGTYQWVKQFERNEALDVRVYARAAAMVIGIDRLKPADWQSMAPMKKPDVIAPEPTAAVKPPAVVETAPAPAPKTQPPTAPRKPVTKRASFW